MRMQGLLWLNSAGQERNPFLCKKCRRFSLTVCNVDGALTCDAGDCEGEVFDTTPRGAMLVTTKAHNSKKGEAVLTQYGED